MKAQGYSWIWSTGWRFKVNPLPKNEPGRLRVLPWLFTAMAFEIPFIPGTFYCFRFMGFEFMLCPVISALQQVEDLPEL